MKALAKPSENDAGRAMGAVVPMRALIAPAAPAKPAGRKRRRSRIAVALEQTQPSHVDLKAIDGSEGWQSRIMDALGTTSPDFVDAEIGRLLKAFQASDGTVSQSLFNAALAVVDGIRPRNEMEAMVGIQMAITHALSRHNARALDEIWRSRSQERGRAPHHAGLEHPRAVPPAKGFHFPGRRLGQPTSGRPAKSES